MWPRRWNVDSRIEHQLQGTQRVLTNLGHYWSSNATSNQPMNYTVLKYSQWCNQWCKNMDLVFKKFNQNLNAKAAFSLGFQTWSF
jgi:hypothetical protein